jgi:hypothetical protein
MRMLLAGLLVILLFLQTGCSSNIQISTGKSYYQTEGVTIRDKGNYCDVVLDFTKGFNHRQIGEQFASGILEVIPDYEELIDSFISENLSESDYQEALLRIDDIKPQLKQDYIDEIEGMSSILSGSSNNVRKDNKLSTGEVFLFNLFLDVVRSSQCSFVSVFGERSSTGKTITGRNLDWYGGDKNQLPRIQGVITIKNPGSTICSIGFVGFQGVITGISDSKVFAAVQESQTGSPYSSTGKRAYTFDLRYALENKKSLNDISEFMKDSNKYYTVNHVIVLSDPSESKVLENNISGISTVGSRVKRAVRTADSKLNVGVTWGIDNAVASVNSFILYGNHDNHTKNKYNTRRWDYIKEQLNKSNVPITPDSIREIMTYCNGNPDAFMDTKYLYNRATLSTVIFQPDNLSLEVSFFPRNSLKTPSKPTFERISIFN